MEGALLCGTREFSTSTVKKENASYCLGAECIIGSGSGPSESELNPRGTGLSVRVSTILLSDLHIMFAALL